MLAFEDGVLSSIIILCNATKMSMLQMEMGIEVLELKAFHDYHCEGFFKTLKLMPGELI